VPSPKSLDTLNALPADELYSVLTEVCSSPAWAQAVEADRPWPDPDALLAANHRATAALTPGDLADAMSGHARIGAPKAGDATSQREQAGVRGTDDALLGELAAANAAYEAKFGHVFLVCATGRTAETMLAALRDRFGNDEDRERGIVRTELGKINAIRLNRLLGDDA
jgi:2-oxo-4-hydroxy-4-carboxy-5-ureidoimidazoline decarboxylase